MGNQTSSSTEEMYEVAMTYYANLPNDQRQLVVSFFRSVDTNGDGKVSADEFSDFVRQNCSQNVPPDLFKLLDRNKDGALDLEEFFPFYYMRKVRVLGACDGCGSFLWGLYFRCVECYDVANQPYDVCCSCYRKNKFTHAHSSEYFLDNYALVQLKQYERERATEGIFEAAKAQYASLSGSEKQELRNSFANIDSDGDGLVSRHEYSDYITESKYEPDVFDVADRNGDGMLNFDEFITLDFIQNWRGYTRCNRCSFALLGNYFVCVKCHHSDKSYHLCCKCYGDKNYKHRNDHSCFKDAHSLFQLRKGGPETSCFRYFRSSRKLRKSASASKVAFPTTVDPFSLGKLPAGCVNWT